jgi:hypothetical protein
MLENYAFSGILHKPISYIDQGTKLTCQCGYEWIENRFPEYAVCPRCDRRQMERDSRIAFSIPFEVLMNHYFFR